MDIHIRHMDQGTWQQARSFALLRGLTMGSLVADALDFYIRKNTETLSEGDVPGLLRLVVPVPGQNGATIPLQPGDTYWENRIPQPDPIVEVHIL